jgi:mono/diheme cytochrome c family protein
MSSSKNTSRSDTGMRLLISPGKCGAEIRTTVPSWRRTGCWLLALAAASALPAWGAELPDAGRGRLLYENHCVVCHTQKVHRRVPPLPIDLKELRQIVTAWAKGQKLGWSENDISDVVEYLDSTYYRMLGR